MADKDVIAEIHDALTLVLARAKLLATIESARNDLASRPISDINSFDVMSFHAGFARGLLGRIFQAADAYIEASKFPPAPSE